MRKQVNATMDVILNGKEKNVINILLTVKTIKLMQMEFVLKNYVKMDIGDLNVNKNVIVRKLNVIF